MFRASQFLAEELPIRLAHRVQELNELPDGLSDMPSIQRVQDWYAQSFEVPLKFHPTRHSRLMHAQEITTLRQPTLTQDLKERLAKPSKLNRAAIKILSQTTQNPSVEKGQYGDRTANATKVSSGRRYFAAAEDGGDWPPELQDYNRRFTATLDKIKRRHDGVVTTVGKWALMIQSRVKSIPALTHDVLAPRSARYLGIQA